MGFQGEGVQRQQQVKYHGLVNQGATCYLNSVLQVLFMTEDFREIITRQIDNISMETSRWRNPQENHSHTRNHAGKEHIESELRELFSALKENDTHTSNITRKLRIENVYEQRDAAEHYEKILRLTSPEASQIFHGELINRTTCTQCKDKTESPAGFWHLPLPLVKNNNEYSVEKGIEDFFHSSVISGDNQMYCERCEEKCDAVLDCVVNRYPEVLVLLLKRFELKFEGNIWRKVKINCPVKIPDTLRIAQNKIYKLYACVDHSGDLQWGHYSARIMSQDDGLWYTFNDLNVEKSPYNHFQLDPTETSSVVYLLFYQRQKETAFTNMGRHDSPRVPPATPPTKTEDEHSFSEKKDDDKTHSKAFNTKDQPVSPASKINTEKMSPQRENFNRQYSYKKNEAKKNTSRKDDFGQDKCHEKSQEIFSKYDASNRSVFQNNTDSVIIEIPDETHAQTSKNKKITHHNFYTMEDTNYKDLHVERTFNDENAKSLSGISTQVMDVDYLQHDGGPGGDKTKRPQLRKAEYGSGENSQSNAKWGKQHVIMQDTRLVQYRQEIQQYQDVNDRLDRNKLPAQVQRSDSWAPSQYRMPKNKNPIGHSHMSNPENPKVRRGGSLLRSDLNSDRQIEIDTGLGRHSFHESRKPYYSQDVQLENFRKETMRTERQMKNARRDPQYDSYKENIARLSQVAHSGPAVQEQYSPESQRTNSGHGRSNSLGSRGKSYSGQNAKRKDSFINKSRHNISSTEAEITPDNVAVEMKGLSVKDSSKRQEELQNFIEVRGVALETNVHQSRKRKFCCLFECFLVLFKKRQTK